jgi:multiple sugar transport system permease protein
LGGELDVPPKAIGDLAMLRTKTIFYYDSFWALLFLLPSVLGFLIFVLFPIAASLGLSFTKWDLSTKMQWIGIKNFHEIFADRVAVKVFLNTLYFIAITVPLLIIIPLLLAIAMNQKMRGIRFFRAAYFLPVVSSMVAISMVWQWMYNKEFGLINYFLSVLGISGPNWLTSATWAMPAIMITSIWKNIGFNMLLFLAGLQSIPASFYEAADLDGVNWYRRLMSLTIPLLSTTTFFVVVMTVISSFQVFDQVVVITGGGPSRSSSVLVHYIYQNAFLFYRMGYASALGWLLFALIFILSLVQSRFSRTVEFD